MLVILLGELQAERLVVCKAKVLGGAFSSNFLRRHWRNGASLRKRPAFDSSRAGRFYPYWYWWPTFVKSNILGMFSVSIIIKHCCFSCLVSTYWLVQNRIYLFFLFLLLGENSGPSFRATGQKRDKYNASMGRVLLVKQINF